MVTVGEKTRKIMQLYKEGMTIEEIAVRFNITPSSVNKRIKSFEKIDKGFYTPSSPNYNTNYIKPIEWSVEKLKIGFERFVSENGRLPTQYEIDDSPYLPSSRQIQRRFGGLSKLRLELGYGEVDFSKGKLRGDIGKLTGPRGGDAEDKLEQILIERFGDLFVQSEKRFGNNRNRVDFLVYAKNVVIGIDVFATNEKRNIQKNVAVKIPKYISFPSDVPLFFVVWSDSLSENEIESAVQFMTKIGDIPNLQVIGLDGLLDRIKTLVPLTPPSEFKPFIQRTNQ